MPNLRPSDLTIIFRMLADVRYLSEGKYTRMTGYSNGFLLDVYRTLEALNGEIRKILNKRMMEETRTPRPFLETPPEPTNERL